MFSTSSILNKLSKTEVTCLPDGIEIRNDELNIHTSMRLSNIPANVNHQVSTLYLLMAFLLQTPFTDAANEVYLKAGNNTHYKLDPRMGFLEELMEKCGLQFSGPIDEYELQKVWSFFTGDPHTGSEGLFLYRGAGEASNDNEKCATDFISQKASLTWLSNPLVIFGIVMGAFALLACCNLAKRCLCPSEKNEEENFSYEMAERTIQENKADKGPDSSFEEDNEEDDDYRISMSLRRSR